MLNELFSRRDMIRNSVTGLAATGLGLHSNDGDNLQAEVTAQYIESARKHGERLNADMIDDLSNSGFDYSELVFDLGEGLAAFVGDRLVGHSQKKVLEYFHHYFKEIERLGEALELKTPCTVQGQLAQGDSKKLERSLDTRRWRGLRPYRRILTSIGCGSAAAMLNDYWSSEPEDRLQAQLGYIDSQSNIDETRKQTIKDKLIRLNRTKNNDSIANYAFISSLIFLSLTSHASANLLRVHTNIELHKLIQAHLRKFNQVEVKLAKNLSPRLGGWLPKEYSQSTNKAISIKFTPRDQPDTSNFFYHQEQELPVYFGKKQDLIDRGLSPHDADEYEGYFVAYQGKAYPIYSINAEDFAKVQITVIDSGDGDDHHTDADPDSPPGKALRLPRDIEIVRGKAGPKILTA